MFSFFRRIKDQKDEAQFRRLYSRVLARDVVMNLPYIGVWVKNSKFELLEISEQAAQMLYNRTSNDCIGLTDYHIARECGSTVDERQFADICRASDLALQDDKPVQFIELIQDTKGTPHIWKTIKSKSCNNGECYYFGFALFLDVMFGSYREAERHVILERPHIHKINETLYQYK